MFRRIAITVISLHCIAILWIALAPTQTKPKLPKRPLAVRTFKEAPKKMAAAPVQAQKPAVKPVAKQAVKKSSPPPKKNKQAAKPAPVKKTTKNKISKDLVQQLEESIAKIETKSDKIVQKKNERASIPEAIEFSSPSPIAEDDQEMIVSTLRRALNLPEYGEVTVELTLKPDGSVEKITVVKAESEKNRKYLESSLTHLTFSKLRGKKQTFLLTFCNEY